MLTAPSLARSCGSVSTLSNDGRESAHKVLELYARAALTVAELEKGKNSGATQREETNNGRLASKDGHEAHRLVDPVVTWLGRQLRRMTNAKSPQEERS
jgi:hypothetical protein